MKENTYLTEYVFHTHHQIDSLIRRLIRIILPTQSKEEHHIGNISVLSTLSNFNCVNDFSLDYQHLVCLGFVRKLILLWEKGPIPIRYASWKIKEISKALVSLKTNIPCEMARKPRILELVNLLTH
ncbi:Uncharacterized protein FWK35_00031595, partial [Aphis craccivora]